MTWSGLSNPTPEVLERIEKYGAAAINGFNGEGGFVNRFDALYPSRSYLSPVADQVGGFFQFNHRAANDYELQGSYDDILDTFINIRDRDLSVPYHVYFHFYSAQTPEALAHLTRVFTWSLDQEISPVHVQEYLRMARDFRSARLESTGPSEYRVRNNGWVRTVFFPRADQHLDIKRSEGVLGAEKNRRGLTVFLDENTSHRIVLTPEPMANHDRYALVSAAGWVEDWQEKDGGLSFLTRGHGAQEMEIQVPKDARFFRVEWRDGASETLKPRFTVRPATTAAFIFHLRHGREPGHVRPRAPCRRLVIKVAL